MTSYRTEAPEPCLRCNRTTHVRLHLILEIGNRSAEFHMCQGCAPKGFEIEYDQRYVVEGTDEVVGVFPQKIWYPLYWDDLLKHAEDTPETRSEPTLLERAVGWLKKPFRSVGAESP